MIAPLRPVVLAALAAIPLAVAPVRLVRGGAAGPRLVTALAQTGGCSWRTGCFSPRVSRSGCKRRRRGRNASALHEPPTLILRELLAPRGSPRPAWRGSPSGGARTEPNPGQSRCEGIGSVNADVSEELVRPIGYGTA